jgi:hypothetical protein
MFNNHFIQNLEYLPNVIELETLFLLLAMSANILYVIVKNYFLLYLMRQQRVSCQYIWVFF